MFPLPLLVNLYKIRAIIVYYKIENAIQGNNTHGKSNKLL